MTYLINNFLNNVFSLSSIVILFVFIVATIQVWKDEVNGEYENLLKDTLYNMINQDPKRLFKLSNKYKPSDDGWLNK